MVVVIKVIVTELLAVFGTGNGIQIGNNKTKTTSKTNEKKKKKGIAITKRLQHDKESEVVAVSTRTKIRNTLVITRAVMDAEYREPSQQIVDMPRVRVIMIRLASKLNYMYSEPTSPDLPNSSQELLGNEEAPRSSFQLGVMGLKQSR